MVEFFCIIQFILNIICAYSFYKLTNSIFLLVIGIIIYNILEFYFLCEVTGIHDITQIVSDKGERFLNKLRENYLGYVFPVESFVTSVLIFTFYYLKTI